MDNLATDISEANAGNAAPEQLPRFMSVKQVASYLQINEKKVYALVGDGMIPASKITGKWLFPKDLVDQWLLESCHGGLLTDRMLIAGSDDPAATEARKTEEYEETFNNPYKAAARGFVDDVIEARTTRPALIRGLELLKTKHEERPARKHGNVPL